MKYCRGCGEKKRLRWPSGEYLVVGSVETRAQYCRMGCAAFKHMIYPYSENAYCNDCGNACTACICSFARSGLDLFEETDLDDEGGWKETFDDEGGWDD